MYKYIVSIIILLIPLVSFAASHDGFYGTYQSYIRDCETSFFVIDKERVSIDECKKLTYKNIDSGENYILIDVMPTQKCARKIIKIERKNVQYKVERKGSRSDVPTFVSLIVTTYENYDNAKTNKPLETRSYRPVEPYKADDQKIIFLSGKTDVQRKQALHEINLQCYAERDKYNEIGLKDPSPDVRKIAASFMRGNPDQFVPLLIDVMTRDSDSDVRASAGFSLSQFYTSNGSEGYLHIMPLENNLDGLLSGLKNVETVRFVVNILGSCYTGDSVAPCYMSAKSREKSLNALQNQFKTINQLGEDVLKKDSRVSWDNRWNFAKHEIERAIQMINKCKLTLR